MAVDQDGLPAEGLDPVLIGHQVPAVHGLAPLAQAVDVEDPHQVVQLIVGRQLQGLPLGAFRHFAVPQEHISHIGQLIQVLGVQGLAHADGQALAQGAGGRLAVGKGRGGVAFQGAAEMAVGHELRGREPSRRGPQGIEQGRGVPLGEDQPVVVGVLRVVQVVAEEAAEKEAGHQLHPRQGRSGVAGAGLGGHGENIVAHPGGDLGQFFQVLLV